MSFPRYPKYKDSGVDWLGEVPAHWATPPLFFRYSCELGKMLDTSRITGESSVPYLRNVDVQWGVINFDELPEMDIEASEYARYTIRPGDLLVCEGGEVGRTAIVPMFSGTIGFQKALHRLRANSDDEQPTFMYHCFKWAAEHGVFALNGVSTIAHLTGEQLRKCRLPKPPKHEQSAIATFLDHETAKIDSLVAEQEKLIALLKEKISSIVLSSIEFPKTREMRLENVAEEISRPVLQAHGEIYRPLGLFNRGRGLFHKDSRTIDEMGDSDFFWVQEGDLIFSGQFAWEGAVALAGSDDSGCVVSHRYPVIRGKSGFALTEYLYALFLTGHGDFLLNENSRGAAGRNRPLNMNSLLKEKVPIPELGIQERVAHAIHKRIGILREISQQIEMLRERRSALISAAVTGKIDVRGVQ